jgi:hypothetical protein
MESLKPILLLMVLAGVGYGVYVALNHAPALEPIPGVPGENSQRGGENAAPGANDSRGNSAPTGGTKISAPGAGLGMSGILNPMGATPNAKSAAPRGDENRANSGPVSSLPFGIGGANLRAPSGNSAAPISSVPPNVDRLPANQTDAKLGDRNVSQPSNPLEDGQSRYEFESARRNAQTMLSEGKLVEALRELSGWYGHPVVKPEEQAALVELLGQLAGSVIYSRQHWLLPAYVVRSSDTLDSIAAQYELPWQLLAKINGIKQLGELTPGQELKVIRGPFQGQLDLQQQWLTVFVDGMYAGRFRVELRGPINKPEGSYPVVKFAANAPGVAAAGPRHISLGGDVQLLCPDEAGAGENSAGAWLGAIHITRPDMDDVFDMLSERSQVTIRR